MDARVDTTVRYQREYWSDELRDEAWPLLQHHWDEVALDKETVPLDPVWETYATLDKAGLLVIVTARHNTVLVGYCSHFICPNLHYRSLRLADNDIFWLDPLYRKGRVGIELLRTAEKHCALAGCNKITMKEKFHVPLGRLFEFLGYRTIEKLHAKTLKVPGNGH